MRWGVVGSRGMTNWDFFVAELDRILDGQVVEAIISGGAVGADTFAQRYAGERGLPFEVFEADWERLRSKAGPRRNSQIVARADVLVAFWDGVSTGTKDSISKAQTAGKPVIVVRIDGQKGELP